MSTDRDHAGSVHFSADGYPKTPATRFLEAAEIPFLATYYRQEIEGSAQFTADYLGLSLHQIVKSIVFMDEAHKGYMVLMHGDRSIDTKGLRKILGVKKLRPAPYEYAHKWTGYEFGGTSPFGMRAKLPVFVESTILEFSHFYINGGKRGLILQLSPEALQPLQPTVVNVAK